MIDTIENKLYLQPILHEKTINVLPQHIYITSNEEIKEDDWVFDIFKNACPVIRQLKTEEEVLGVQETEFKIILTTDQYLIADGVQSIDDEFLEWFVNNSSCEFVEIRKYHSGVLSDISEITSFLKIIIPQEESKQEPKLDKNGCLILKRI